MCNNCRRSCYVCDNLVFSRSVTFAGGVLVVNIPAGSYNAGDKACLLIAQSIPVETTIAAPVVITIGDGTVQYPLNNRCCAQLTACALRTRRIYPVTVVTTPTGGSFRTDGYGACAPSYNLPAIDGTPPVTGGAAG